MEIDTENSKKAKDGCLDLVTKDIDGFCVEGVTQSATVGFKEGGWTSSEKLVSFEDCTNRAKNETYPKHTLRDDIETWRKGMVKRLRLEDKDIYYWGNRDDENFGKLLFDSASDSLKVTVLRQLTPDLIKGYLHDEMVKFFVNTGGR